MHRCRLHANTQEIAGNSNEQLLPHLALCLISHRRILACAHLQQRTPLG